MRVGYLGAAAASLGIMLASAGFAATVVEPLKSPFAVGEMKAELVFEAPEEPAIIDPPAPDNCAADGPGCPQFVPPTGGNGDFGEIPLPPAIFALVAGIVALFGLGRRRRSA